MSVIMSKAVKNETTIKADMCQAIAERGGYVVPIPGGSYGRNGAPDYVACYRGRFIGIEGKVPSGLMSGYQLAEKMNIEKAGGFHVICRSTEDIVKVLDTIDEVE